MGYYRHSAARLLRARAQATKLVQGPLKVLSDALRTSNDVEQLLCSMGQGHRCQAERLLGHRHLNGDSAFYPFHMLVNPPKVAYREDLEATPPISQSFDSADRRIMP